MCRKCRRDPEIIPPVIVDAMIPAALIHDNVNATIVIQALNDYAENYITMAGNIAAQDDCTSYARLTHMSNMTNITERVVMMIESITENALASCESVNTENGH